MPDPTPGPSRGASLGGGTPSWPGPALAGLRVLDLSSYFAAPLLAAMLGDLGADVVKVEPPEGDGFRVQADLWALSARHKRSVVCDQETEQGRAQVARLIGASDVVVTNLPGPSAERRGLSWAQVSAHAPHVVLVNLTGFGAGPLEALPGNGTVAEAFAGLSHLTGLPDGAPLSPSVPLGDAVAAGFGVGGVVAAAWQAARTGVGTQVEVTMYEPLLQLVAPALTELRPDVDGSEPRGRTGGSLPGNRLRGSFVAADGKWFALSMSSGRHESAAGALVGAAPGADLAGPMADWAATLPRDEAVRLLTVERVPVSPVQDAREVANDPHVRSRRSVVRLAGDAEGRLLPSPATRIGPDPRADIPALATVGEHTDQVFQEWCTPPGEVTQGSGTVTSVTRSTTGGPTD